MGKVNKINDKSSLRLPASGTTVTTAAEATPLTITTTTSN